MTYRPSPILFTIPNFITAGSGRVMLNILERLDPKEFSPSVCVLKRGGGMEKELEARCIPLLEMPFTIPVRPYATLPRRAWQAARSFRAFGFKLWHSFHYADDYSEPLIARLSGAEAWLYTKKSMSWGSRAWRLRSWLATRIVADNSEMPAKFFSRPLLAKKVRVIHHGLPLDEFHPSTPPRLCLREKYRIRPDEILLGCVAQLVPVKGHPVLIQAMAAIPEAHLFLAGKLMDTEYVAALEGQVRTLGLEDRVHFLGGVDDVPALLAETDIAVLPTRGSGRMEGCPVALLEAMASGKACVATDIPGSRDLIVHGESGLLVRPEDPEALADALRTLISDPGMRLGLGRAARRRVEEHFSIEREVAAHEALYREILGDGRV